MSPFSTKTVTAVAVFAQEQAPLLWSVSQEKKGQQTKILQKCIDSHLNGSIEGRVPVDPLIPLAVGAMRYKHNEQTTPTKDYQSSHHDHMLMMMIMIPLITVMTSSRNKRQ